MEFVLARAIVFARDMDAMVAFFRIADPPEARSDAVTKLVFRVDDLAAARRALHAQGVIEVHQEFLSEPPVRCDFLDPEGNVFQISSL